MQYLWGCNLTHPYYVLSKYTTMVWRDDDCTFMFVACMQRYHVGPGRTEKSAFVLMRAWIWSCNSCLMYSELVIISPRCAVKIYYNVDDGCAFMFVARTVSSMRWSKRMQYVCIDLCLDLKLLFVFDAMIWKRAWSHPDVRSKYTTMAMTAVRLCSLNVWNDVMFALDEQDVRLYCWLVFAFEAVISVRHSMGSSSHADMLSKYITMSIASMF